MEQVVLRVDWSVKSSDIGEKTKSKGNQSHAVLSWRGPPISGLAMERSGVLGIFRVGFDEFPDVLRGRADTVIGGPLGNPPTSSG